MLVRTHPCAYEHSFILSLFGGTENGLWGLAVSAAAVLTVAAMALEGSQLGVAGRQGAAGWLLSQYAFRVLYLALVPGIVGHQGTASSLELRPPSSSVVEVHRRTEP
jgi:hypothetical protein